MAKTAKATALIQTANPGETAGHRW